MSQVNIPVVDLNDFMSLNNSSREAFVQKLGKAYEEVGFVAVKNHALDDALTERLYKEVKGFFELPMEVKRTYEIAGLAGQRGYTSFGTEHAKGSDQPDLKEFWHFGQEVIGGSSQDYGYPENVHVNECPDFYPTAMQAYRALEKTGKYMLRAIAIHLGLEEDFFDSAIHNGNSILRPIHYAPITGEPHGAVRAGQHEDINLITLLMGASADGLEIQSKSGDWVPVTALPEHLVVNVGDMLQRLTNNRLKSTTHRVVNPPKEKWAEPRFSIPFFLHPISEFSLNCLPSCIDAEHPRQYDDITAGAFLDERLKEIGLK